MYEILLHIVQQAAQIPSQCLQETPEHNYGPCLIAPIGKNTTDHLQREHEQNISSSSRTGRATQVSPALI